MRWEVVFRSIVALGVILGVVVLMLAVWEVYPQVPLGAGAEVLDRIGESGLEHPVTAVLLNFRAYDTLLEVVVLVVAFWGAWSLQIHPEKALSRHPGLLLSRVAAALIPILVVMAVYLLWAGSHQPGGEFQAGAVLGAAGVMTLLVGRPVPGARRVWLCHFLGVVGAGVFIVVATVGLLATGHFLAYPAGWEKPLILVIEAGTAISIGFILVALFAGTQERLVGDVAFWEADDDS